MRCPAASSSSHDRNRGHARANASWASSTESSSVVTRRAGRAGRGPGRGRRHRRGIGWGCASGRVRRRVTGRRVATASSAVSGAARRGDSRTGGRRSGRRRRGSRRWPDTPRRSTRGRRAAATSRRGRAKATVERRVRLHSHAPTDRPSPASRRKPAAAAGPSIACRNESPPSGLTRCTPRSASAGERLLDGESSDVIGTHRDHHRRRVGGVGGEPGTQRPRPLSADVVEGEQLFELVDDQHRVARRDEATALVIAACGSAPGTNTTTRVAGTLQRWDQPGAHQRRLATPRRTR